MTLPTTFKTLLFASGFILMGAGCNYAATDSVGDLPTTPPDTMMEQEKMEDEAMMDDSGHDSEDAIMEDDTAKKEVEDGFGNDLEESNRNDTDDDGFGDTGMEYLDTDDDGDGVKTEDEKMDSAMSALKPYYIAYTPEVAEAAMKEGRPVVYYFWASWCPICKAEEPQIKSWIETSEHPIAGFRVNYDKESALKKQYKVSYQHTTVFLNADGTEVERFNAATTETDFRAALEKLVL